MNGSIVDSTAVNNNLSTGLSKGRSPDGVGEWCYFDTPTPDELNGESYEVDEEGYITDINLWSEDCLLYTSPSPRD